MAWTGQQFQREAAAEHEKRAGKTFCVLLGGRVRGQCVPHCLNDLVAFRSCLTSVWVVYRVL